MNLPSYFYQLLRENDPVIVEPIPYRNHGANCGLPTPDPAYIVQADYICLEPSSNLIYGVSSLGYVYGYIRILEISRKKYAASNIRVLNDDRLIGSVQKLPIFLSKP